MTGKKDLTRIEDLSEFIHQEDEEADSLFASDDSELPGLEDLEDDSEAVNEFPYAAPDDEKEEEDPFSEKTSLHELDDDTGIHQTPVSTSFGEEETFDFSEGDSFGSDFSDAESTETSEEGEFTLEEPGPLDFSTDEPEIEAQAEEDAPPEPELEVEPEPEPEPEPKAVQAPPRAAPEKFEDIRQFGESIVYGKITAGGNPPYSVMIQNIKFQEDAEDIAILLREIGLLNNDNEQAYTEALKNGALLVSQLGEYAAIYLAHKLRRFDLELRLGLSEEIHPSKNYEGSEKGLVRKDNLRQNKQETLSLQLAPQRLENILVMTANTPEGYRVHRYLGIVTSHRFIQESDLIANEGEEPILFDDLEVKELAEHHFSKPTPHELYQSLALELRQEAMKLKANAVIGITFSLTPLIEKDPEHQQRYKVTCTGNAAWLSGLGG